MEENFELAIGFTEDNLQNQEITKENAHMYAINLKIAPDIVTTMKDRNVWADFTFEVYKIIRETNKTTNESEKESLSDKKIIHITNYNEKTEKFETVVFRDIPYIK